MASAEDLAPLPLRAFPPAASSLSANLSRSSNHPEVPDDGSDAELPTIAAPRVAGPHQRRQIRRVFPESLGEPRLDEPPVVLTVYRLLVTLQLVTLGIVKAVVSYEGHAILSTTLDLILCLLGIVTLYWLGPCEALRPKVMPRIFHRDVLQALSDWFHSRKPTVEEEAEALGDPSQAKPRLAVSLHRLFGTILLLGFGTAKAVLGYKGNALAGTTLDWILGVFLALLLYWVGLFEWSRPGVAPWFYHRDLLSGEERVQELDPEEYVDHHENVLLNEFPRFSIKITGYRILTTTIILGFGLAKASLSYMGRTVVPITLEWVMGVLAAIILYWVGFYEAPRTKVSPAFFQRDYSDKVTFDSLGPNLFFVFIGLLIAAGHLYVTSTFVSLFLTKLPTDNAADRACRVIMYIWFGIAAIGLLLTIWGCIAEGELPSGETVIGFAMGWYIVYFFLIVFLAFIKGSLGYHDPNAPSSDPRDPDTYKWTVCVSFFVTYCWYW